MLRVGLDRKPGAIRGESILPRQTKVVVSEFLVHSLFIIFVSQADPSLDEIVRTIGLDFGSGQKTGSTLCEPVRTQQ